MAGAKNVKAADAAITEDEPAVKRPGSTARSHPTEFRGYEGDNVRPADNRFLTEAQIEKRDEYVAEVTGPEAQQLVVKREADEDE